MANEMDNAETKEMERVETNEGEESREVFSPYLDIIEKRDAFEVLADVPGATADGINISVDNGILRLQVQVTPPEIECLPLLYQEYGLGDYEASLRISDRIDVAQIEAKLKDGIITLVLPKREEAKPRQIEIRAA